MDLLKQATSSVGADDNVTVIEHFISALEQEIIERVQGNNLGNVSYSTDEHLTGANWIDGKPIYRKVVVTGAVPIGAKLVNHNIVNLDTVVDFKGVLVDPGVGSPDRIMFNDHSVANGLSVQMDSDRITLVAGTNGFADADSHVIIEYTKN